MPDTNISLDLASQTGQNDIFNALIAAFAALGGISVNINHVDVTADRQAAETARDQAVAAKDAIANIEIGTVETGAAGSSASVTVSTDETTGNLVLNFVIPQGNTGTQGIQGETGSQGIQGETGSQGIQGETGNGISSISKTATNGNVDTYTITFTNGSTTTFDVTNGTLTPPANNGQYILSVESGVYTWVSVSDADGGSY